MCEYFTREELKLIRHHIEILLKDYKPQSETQRYSVDQLNILLPKLPELDSKIAYKVRKRDEFIEKCNENMKEIREEWQQYYGQNPDMQ